jgi:CHAT domain-containing protein
MMEMLMRVWMRALMQVWMRVLIWGIIGFGIVIAPTLPLMWNPFPTITIAEPSPGTTTSTANPSINDMTELELHEELNRLWTEGIAAYNTGSRAAGLEAAGRVMAIYEQLGDRQWLGHNAAWFAALHIGVGDYERALSWINHLESAAIAVGDAQNLGSLYDNKGLALFQLGEYQAALLEYAKAITWFEQSDTVSPGYIGHVWNHMAAVHQQLGNFDQAIALVEQSYALSQAVEDDALALQTADYLGKFERERANYQAAEGYQQHALDLAIALNHEMRKHERGYLASIESIDPAYRDVLPDQIKFVRPLYEADRIANLAHTYAAWGKLDRARDFAERAYSIAHQDINGTPDNSDYDFFNWTMGTLGAAYRTLGDYERAEELLREAIETQERVRSNQFQQDDRLKILFAETYANVFDELQLVLVAQGKAIEALEVAERGRARAFVELIAERLETGRTPEVIPPTLEQMRQLARKLDTTIIEYTPIEREHTLLVWVVTPTDEIQFAEVDLSGLEMSLEHLIFAARCSNRVCLRQVLSYTRGSFAVSRETLETLQAYATPPEAATTSHTNSNTPVNPYLQQLYDLMIAPIAQWLPSDPNARVAISPQGSLFLVPFAALQDASGTYLIERHTLLTTPSIQVLDRTHDLRQTVHTRSALVVGNPTMPDNLTPLAGAEAEARTVAHILKTQPLTGNAATEAAVRRTLENSRIVHLATHGTFDERDGLRSAIAFAPTAELDGWLTSREVLDLDLNAEVVVLSACSTGRGRITGDGVIGLSRSLVASGASSVVVSLWNVDDAATEALMGSFYDAWSRTELDKAQALRVAMLETMQEFPQPYFWSAFTFIGEPQ